MLARAVALNDGNGRAHYYLALALAAQQQFDSALSHYTTARSLQPEVDSVPELHFLFSGYFAQTGRTNLALASARKALALAEASGNTNLTQTVKARLGELNAPSKGK
jgi:tetratricopeptide (TPR) repeat protein